MRKLALLLVCLATGAVASAADPAVSLGYSDQTILQDPQDDNCSSGMLYYNNDGSFENAYAWQYGGVMAPYYGAFAEGYDVGDERVVWCVALWLTQVGYYTNQTCDVYVWESDGSNPTNVLGVVTGVLPSGIAYWPSISQHDVDVNVYCPGAFFVGYWGTWLNSYAPWYCAADLDGFGGLPRTNIAPGIGYPTGWQDPSIIWGTTQSMGLGGYFGERGSPAQPETWGSIKALFE